MPVAEVERGRGPKDGRNKKALEVVEDFFIFQGTHPDIRTTANHGRSVSFY
jgi:hypothetical protein